MDDRERNDDAERRTRGFRGELRHVRVERTTSGRQEVGPTWHARQGKGKNTVSTRRVTCASCRNTHREIAPGRGERHEGGGVRREVQDGRQSEVTRKARAMHGWLARTYKAVCSDRGAWQHVIRHARRVAKERAAGGEHIPPRHCETQADGASHRRPGSSVVAVIKSCGCDQGEVPRG